MKRHISLGLCVLLAFNLSAQKALIIHKTDGTKIEIPIGETPRLYTTGKAIVYDNDYIRNHNVEVDIPRTYPEKPQVNIIDVLNRAVELEAGGICISTSPGVDIEKNDTCILTWEGDFILRPDTMENSFVAEYNTTYYVRSYVKFLGAYYYSEEHSVYVDHPRMSWYGVSVDSMPYEQTGYVMPSDSAWKSLAARYPALVVKGGIGEEVKEQWNAYLTPERIGSLKPLCATVYECCDGMLYVLDSIGDDFAGYATDCYDDEYIMSGYTELDENAASRTVQSYVECSEEWGVPGNGYWKYAPATITGNFTATYTLTQPMLAGYNYSIEVTFAPDTEQTDTVPTKYILDLSYRDESGKKKRIKLATKALASQSECTVAAFDSIVAGGFGEALLEIKSNVLSSEKDKYSRTLRIAQIKVTPVGPYKQQEAVAVKEE